MFSKITEVIFWANRKYNYWYLKFLQFRELMKLLSGKYWKVNSFNHQKGFEDTEGNHNPWDL